MQFNLLYLSLLLVDVLLHGVFWQHTDASMSPEQKCIFDRQEVGIELYKLDHSHITVDDEMTYYKHLKDIGTYMSIAVTVPAARGSVVTGASFPLTLTVNVKLPAVAFKLIL